MKKRLDSRKIIVLVTIMLLTSMMAVPTNFGSAMTSSVLSWKNEVPDSGAMSVYGTDMVLDSSGNQHIVYNDANSKFLKYASWTGSEWTVKVVDEASAYQDAYPSLVFDKFGIPHISYINREYNLCHAWWNGASWQTETVDSSCYGSYTSIATNLVNGKVYISYYDGNIAKLKIAEYNDASWSIDTIDTAGDAGSFSSIAVDSNGNPHISCYNQQNRNLMYVHYNSGSWDIQTADPSDNVGMYTSIALTSEDHPCISYYDEANHNLKYTYFDSEKWNSITVDSTGDVGVYTALVLSSNDIPHISYYSSSNGELKYARITETWEVEVIPTTTVSVAMDGSTSIVLDSNDKPIISYGNWDQKALQVARKINNLWHIYTVDESSVGLHTSIAVDNSGPHISYFDASGTLKYAYIQGTCTGSYWVTSALFSGNPDQPTSIALDSNSQPHILYIDSTGTYLMHAWFDRDDYDWKREIISSNVGYGGYGIAIDSNDYIHVTYPNNNNEYLMYACKDNAGWHRYTADSSGDGVTNPSIVTDQNNIPHIAYGDYAKNLKYAWLDDPNWRITTVKENCFGEFPIMGTDIALNSEGYPHICYYGDGVNYAWYNGVRWNQETIDSEGDYASLALNSNDNPFISYYNKENADLMGAVKEDSSWQYDFIDSEGNVGMYSSLAIDSNDTPHISYYDADNPSLKYATSTYVTIEPFDYTAIDSNTVGGPTYNWIEISPLGNQILTSEDDGIEWVSPDFVFNFYGEEQSGFWVCSNGFLKFGEESSEPSNEPISSAGMSHFIAPFWSELVTLDECDAGEVYYQTLGTAPNRIFVVQWQNLRHFVSDTTQSGQVTFEAILYEDTNNILFQYKDVDFDNTEWNNGASATVGIEDETGARGLQYSYNEPVLSAGLAVLFRVPITGTNLQITLNTPTNTYPGSTITYSLYYTNFGDDPAENVELTLQMYNVNFVSASNGGSYNSYDSQSGIVSWNLGNMAAYPDGYGTVTVTVIVPDTISPDNSLSSYAQIVSSTDETRYDDNNALRDIQIVESPLPPNAKVTPIRGVSDDTPIVSCNTPIIFEYVTDDSATRVAITIDDGTPETFEMSGGPPDWSYTYNFNGWYGKATISYMVYYGSTPNLPVSFSLYVDPAGYIYNIDTNQRIEGATVWLQQPDGMGGWENVPVGTAIMVPDDNPQVTGPDGQYQWDTLEGTYRVHVEAPGYYPADSITVSVPPAVTDLHVGLQSTSAAAPTDLTIDYSPSTVDKTVPNSVLINGELTSEGIGVEGRTIALYWQDNVGAWIYIGDATTEDDGSYAYTWTPTSAVPNGQHLLKAVFAGDDEYLGCEAQTGPDGLFVVPEYPFGCLLALLACFAALFVSKKGKLSASKTI